MRQADERDAEALAELGAKTFSDTYMSHFTNDFDLDALRIYLAATFSVEATLKELQTLGAQFFVLETESKRCIGYMKIGTPKAPDCVQGAKTLCLERIYVDQEYHSQGFGRQLLKQCEDVARAQGCGTVWLGCWDGNHGPLEFYRRQGFQVVGAEDFRITGTEYSDTDLILEKHV